MGKAAQAISELVLYGMGAATALRRHRARFPKIEMKTKTMENGLLSHPPKGLCLRRFPGNNSNCGARLPYSPQGLASIS